jgi:hypothetical protein
MSSEILMRYPRFATPADTLSQGTASNENRDGKVYFNDRGVVVTDTGLFLPGRRAYAIDGITEVWMHEDTPSQIGPILCIFAGAGIGVLSFATIWIAITAILAGIFWLALLKPRFSVVLSSLAGETLALEGTDSRWIQNVVSALSKAIADRA